MKRTKREGHANSRDPISSVHPVPVTKGDQRKDDQQLGCDDRLHQAQTSHPQGCNLKGEAENHAGDAQEPDGPMEQVMNEMETQTIFTRGRCRGATLRDRGQCGEDTCRQSKCHNLGPHGIGSQGTNDACIARINAATTLTTTKTHPARHRFPLMP